MIVFRWIIGVITGLFAVGALVSYILYGATGDDRWSELARRLGGFLKALALFWFNVEIWGRVVWTLFHWNSPPGS